MNKTISMIRPSLLAIAVGGALMAGALPAVAADAAAPEFKIYGLIDAGVERISNVKSSPTGTQAGTVYRLPSVTASLPSRVGITGSKDLGDGYKGVFTAEMGINTDDGTLGQGGRVFGRQLFAGVDTPYGAFTIGRQWSMLLYPILKTDVLGPNIYAMGSMDPYLASMRYDNSLAWKGTFGGLSAGFLYSTGRNDVATTTTVTSTGAPQTGYCAGEGTSPSCRGWSAMVAYDDAAWGVSGAIDVQKGGTNSTASFYNGGAVLDFSSPSDTDQRVNVGGYYKLDALKIAGGILNRSVETRIYSSAIESKAIYLGASYALTDKVTLDGGLVQMKYTDANSTTLPDADATLYAVRAFYTLTKGLQTYVQYGHISNGSNAKYGLSGAPGVFTVNKGDAQDGVMTGMRYFF